MSLSGSHDFGHHNQARDSQLPTPTPSYTSTYATSTGVAPHASSYSHFNPRFRDPWIAHPTLLYSQVSPSGPKAGEGQESLGITTTTVSTPIHPASARIAGRGASISREMLGSQARVESSPNDIRPGGLAYASSLTSRTTESLSKEFDATSDILLTSASDASYLYQQGQYSTPQTPPVQQEIVSPLSTSHRIQNTPATHIGSSYSHPAATHQAQLPAHNNQCNRTVANTFSEGQSSGAFPRPIRPSRPREGPQFIHGIAPENNSTFTSTAREPHMALQHHIDRSAQYSPFQVQNHPSPLPRSDVARQLPLAVSTNSHSQSQAYVTSTGSFHNVMANTTPWHTAQVQRMPLGNTTSLKRNTIASPNLLQPRSPSLPTSHPTSGSESSTFPYSAPVSVTPNTVDPNMVYNPYRGNGPQASSTQTSGRQQLAQVGAAPVTPTLAQKAAETITDQGSSVHSKTNDTDPINAKSTPNTPSAFTGPPAKGGGVGTDGSTATGSPDSEADVRMMLERVRQYHARNPSTFAKLWEETKRVRFIPGTLISCYISLYYTP